MLPSDLAYASSLTDTKHFGILSVAMAYISI